MMMNQCAILTLVCAAILSRIAECQVRRSSVGSFLSDSIFGLMRQTPAVNHVPRVPRDLFDLLRYNYPPPAGGLMESYDFIIVGGGTAGSVLASRLSENRNWNVLLLEAGGTESYLTDVPIFTSFLLQSRYQWDYLMEKTDGMCKGAINEQCPLFRGRGLGGSSLINYMMYTRGNRKDWDQIAAAGNPEWSFDKVFPYFMKSERAKLKGLEKSKYHNKHGLLSIEDVPFKTNASYAFLEAGVELGYKHVDYNEGDGFGFSHIQSHTRNGRRHSASKAFLYPFRHRPNLHISTRSKVTRINIDPGTKRATSVTFIHNKQYRKVKASREVVLTAGTLISPQILMLSGVGPREHLEEMGIGVISDSRVGYNMHDHIGFCGITFLLNDTRAVFDPNSIGIGDFRSLLDQGRGPLTSIVFEAIAHANTLANSTDPYPDIEIAFAGGGWTSDRGGVIRKGLKISDEFFNSTFGEIVGRPCFSMIPLVLYSESRGRVRLKDKNPFRWPIFTYDMKANDFAILKRGIDFAIKIGKTEAFRKYGAKLYQKPYPGCERFEFASDEYWNCAGKFTTYPGQHHMGTCKMGPLSDKDAVVDQILKVYGVEGLRVGDLSVVPAPISAHTNSIAIMIGEKLADMIKEDWGGN